MIRMMDEIERYKKIIKSGLTSPRELEEMQRLVDVSTKILEWFEDQGKHVTNANYDTDTGILVFDMQNTSGMDFRELEFDILADESLHTVSFQDWKDGEYRKVHFTHYFDSTDNMSVTLQGDSIAFELMEETVEEDEAGQDGSYPVKIPLGNWILKSGEDGNQEVVPLKQFFNEDGEDGLTFEDILDMPIEEMGLSTRAYNGIRRAGIVTVRDLVSRTEHDMYQIRCFGRKSFEEIKGWLEAAGLSFKKSEVEDGIAEDESYSVDVTGIVDHIIKAMVPESISEEEEGDSAESLTIDEDTTNDVEEDNGDREEECFLRIERDNHQETSRLEKARREVRLQRLISKEGEKPGLEEMMFYLKYLGYNAEEIEYALQELEDEPSEEVGGEEFD